MLTLSKRMSGAAGSSTADSAGAALDFRHHMGRCSRASVRYSGALIRRMATPIRLKFKPVKTVEAHKAHIMRKLNDYHQQLPIIRQVREN